jgi:Fe-S oxidoreductase
MLEQIPAIDLTDLKGHCCGMAGSWGLSRENYRLSETIASDMIQRLNASSATTGATDCPTCRMQMEHFCGKPILHPIQIVADRLPR